jgi:hypothetical protein
MRIRATLDVLEKEIVEKLPVAEHKISYITGLMIIIIIIMKWAGNIAHMPEMRNVYIILVRNPEGKKPTRKTKA